MLEAQVTSPRLKIIVIEVQRYPRNQKACKNHLFQMRRPVITDENERSWTMIEERVALSWMFVNREWNVMIKDYSEQNKVVPLKKCRKISLYILIIINLKLYCKIVLNYNSVLWRSISRYILAEYIVIIWIVGSLAK